MEVPISELVAIAMASTAIRMRYFIENVVCEKVASTVRCQKEGLSQLKAEIRNEMGGSAVAGDEGVATFVMA